VDHTHADAVLSVVDQPGSEGLCREVFGDRALFVPYVMPGFDLARRVAEAWARQKRAPTCMILDKHGIFTWGTTALESYERMIANVTRAERWVEEQRADASRQTISGASGDLAARVAPIARGVLGRLSKRSWIASFRATAGLLAFCDREDLADVSSRGCVTPDHVMSISTTPPASGPSSRRRCASTRRSTTSTSVGRPRRAT
jgi:rhamnose utilization protein RhaD (predicted bifunctional aldolase and dehydrogenase)